jgi:hypothetical protein
VVVQAPPGAITLDRTADFSAGSPASLLFNSNTPATGTWTTTTDARFQATAAGSLTPATNLIGTAITPGSLIDITVTMKTFGQGGVVFDYQGPSYYKFVTLSADSRQIVIGHRTGAGTVIDRTFATTISSGVDYVLGVKLRGGLVNVSLAGSVLTSFAYNETITIGGYGLMSMMGATSGVSSFDVIRMKTDDAAYGPPSLFASVAPAQVPKIGSALDGTMAGAIPSVTTSPTGTIDATAVAALPAWPGVEALGRMELPVVLAEDFRATSPASAEPGSRRSAVGLWGLTVEASRKKPWLLESARPIVGELQVTEEQGAAVDLPGLREPGFAHEREDAI